MPNDYRENKKLKEYFEYYINQMSVGDIYKPILVEIMMRRSHEFDLSPSEICKDLTSLINNITSISVGPMPDDCKRAAGIYSYAKREIVLSKDYLKNAKTDDDFEILFEILTHEVNHALEREPGGNSKLSQYKDGQLKLYSSLEEAIVEKASDRCVFSREWKEDYAPFFHQNEFGYSDITYVADLIEAAYGVAEKAFLRNAIQGRDKLCEFLSGISGEPIGDTEFFIEMMEINYSRLHRTLYNSDLKGKALQTEVQDVTIALLKQTSYKLNSNLKLQQTKTPEDIENAEMMLDCYRYGFDKMQLVAKNVANGLENKFASKGLAEHILRSTSNLREKNSMTINAMTQIINRRDEIPKQDFEAMMFALKKDAVPPMSYVFERNQIGLEAPDFLPLGDEFLSYRKTDFESTQWENSGIIEQLKAVQDLHRNDEKQSLGLRIKNAYENMKQRFLAIFNKQKILPSGQECQAIETSDIWTLSPEELESFNIGANEVITNAGHQKDGNKNEREEIDY